MVAQLGNFTKIQMGDFMKCKLYLNRVVKIISADKDREVT